MRQAQSPTTSALRPEYDALARDFAALASHFGIPVERAAERTLFVLMAAFETVDRHVDAIANAARRKTLSDDIVRFLREGRAPRDALPSEVDARLRELRGALVERGALDAFADALARFFEHTEILRTTTRADTFVRCVLDEAQRAAEMTLLVSPRPTETRFERFFPILAEVANLVDKLHDVRGDRRRGEVAVDAGIALHLRLFVALTVRGMRLLWLSPRPLRLVGWGARHVLPP